MTTRTGVDRTIASLPKFLGGLGCVPGLVERDRDVLTLGHAMLHASGVAGEVSSRFAATRAGSFWASFAETLSRLGGEIDASGSLYSFPDVSGLPLSILMDQYESAKDIAPLRAKAEYLRAPLTAHTFAGNQPVRNLPDRHGPLAAQLASLSSPVLPTTCCLCLKPDSAGQAGHHRR